MKFKIDENLPAEIAGDLRFLGHEADTVVDEVMAAAPDPAIIAKVGTLDQRETNAGTFAV